MADQVLEVKGAERLERTLGEFGRSLEDMADAQALLRMILPFLYRIFPIRMITNDMTMANIFKNIIKKLSANSIKLLKA